MEAEATGCSMGIQYIVQGTHWNTTLPDRLRENLPFTRRAGAESALGHLEVQYGYKTSQRVPKVPDLETGGMERQSLS